MMLLIEILDEVKQVFDTASDQDVNNCYYDFNSVIAKSIKKGIVIPKRLQPFTKGENEVINNNMQDSGWGI